MTLSAFAISTTMIHWEGVAKSGWLPGTGGVAAGTLPGIVVSRTIPAVTTLAFGVSRTMVKCCRAPGTGGMAAGTLPGIVIGWSITGMTTLTVCTCGAVVKSCLLYTSP